MNVLTITLNPAVDKTLEVEGFHVGGLNKVAASRADAGGKGINVSRVLKSLGTDSLATGLIGGRTGDFIIDAIDKLGIDNDFVHLPHDTRTNLKVFDRLTKTITEINEPGPEVQVDKFQSLLDKVSLHLRKDMLVILSGSIPASVGVDAYSRLIQIIEAQGALAVLDADGAPFKAAIKAAPFMIKPNRDELIRYFNSALDTEEDLLEAMNHFISLGVKHVFVTLGSEGAYYRSEGCAYRLKPLKIEAHSSVGAGDAFVGGVVHALSCGFDVETMLRYGVASSAGAVTTIGTNPASKEWILNHIRKVELIKLMG